MVRILVILLFGFSVCYGQANRFAGFGSRVTVGCSSANYLTDAQRFIDSSGITDTVEIRAIKELVKGLQDSCLWTKMKAVYPFVGSTASTNKWNLVNPVNADTAYRIVFSGTLSYGSYGIQGNGSTGYGDTKFKPSNFASNSGAMGVYIGNNLDQVSATMGESNAGLTTGWMIIPRIANTFYASTGSASGYATAANTNTIGFWIVLLRNSSTSRLRKNNTEYIATLFGGVTTSTNNIFLCARNQAGTAGAFSTHRIGFAFFSGVGLTDDECNALYVVENQFKTTLGR